ncbi:precorrin-6Y C5,15-methyltransferase (decarboxylating) subunit CbiT [Desulforamulus hydrothermalis]|uniref:Putative cobalt-precorrin-6Y C(15)-methyltransferase (Decarboxylating) n=1 Tax=Desulforamulus hydrothermalis Lam5 = DSM 18033 TaxID=1121428 RepID=K8EH74_9FIRM|nr:precorrin-6Y C5,15-methyltransferase (decarboxylating) subunit CbiT [Desulforamulus hydrothermalis]CCO07981.1 putative cobalt-precorrin-6Y C(15)-methyltransferase (decarboxylating) [Desulforamulus hydrothermalis Lam5 = DSM 18033]SHG84861.1 cobalt-precorrin 7 C15-methyltransferase [Desulforamulus hydrothermalis Lam5 = DSM 18033]
MSKTEWPYITPGMPDHLFKRAGGIAMTKQEIRLIVLGKLRLFPGAVVYDVGAGTGSVTVECARLVKPGTVYALEQDAAADELVETNVRRFGLSNVKLVPGRAPATMAKLPAADRIFIGGSNGALTDILQAAHRKLKPGGWLAATAVTLETGPLVMRFLIEQGYQQAEAVSVTVAVARQAGESHLWQGHNPVLIISGQKPV